MKSNSLKILILLGFLVPVTYLESHGQGAGLEGFSLKVSPGALVYYGDLSTNNLNLPKRIATGSKFGTGAGIIKQFSPFFGIQAQFMAGSLYTTAADNTYFAGSLTEFSLSARFDPIRLLKGKPFRLSPYISVGVASFGFRSVRREMYTNVVILPNFGYNTDGVTNARKQTAMSMPIAVGLSYKILPYLQVELEHAVRMTNTDLLDCVKGPGTANDLYSLTSIGIRVTIPTRKTSIPDQPLPLENVPEVKPTLPVTNFFVDFDIPETIKSGQTIDVILRINKGNFKGPGKIIQKYPEGFTAIENSKNTNSFLFSNQNAIIEWKQLPSDSTVIYDYKIQVGESMKGNQTIVGKFEYEESGATQTIRFNKSVFIDDQKPAAEQEVTSNKLLNLEDNTDNSNTNRITKGNIKQSQPLAGIEFRVQCGAFRDKGQADTHLAAKYNISEVIQEEFTDRWYKYTVGSFRTYEEAVRYRDSFIARTGILSSFIVAYKNGQRLSDIADAFK
jgi:hypothetical protein